MLQRMIIFSIAFILLIHPTNFLEGKHSYNNIEITAQNKHQIAYIGEVIAATHALGFVSHDFFLDDEKVSWLSEDGKINGMIHLNYSIYYSWKKMFPRFIAVGFLVYYNGKKLGGNEIFTTSRREESFMGSLLTNISFTYNGESHLNLYVLVWFFGFPANPVNENAGLLNWLTLGIFDAKMVKIEVNVSEKMKTTNQDAIWLHNRHDIRNTGYTFATGKGNIENYRIKKVFCKYLSGMGTGEPKVVDIDNDGTREIIFGTQTGYLYAIENGWKMDWKCKLNASARYISPEIGDVNGDGNYEIVIASDDLFETDEAGVRIIDKDGNILAIWKNPEGGFPLGMPRVVDLNEDGKDEILVGLLGDDKRGNKLYALSYENGVLKELWSYPAYSWVKLPPAIADINNDGKLEIVFTSYDMCIYCLDTEGKLIWNYTTKGGIQRIRLIPFERFLLHPIVYDINNDGYMEIITTTCLHDKPNWSAVYCIDYNGNLIWKFEPSVGIRDSAAVADINRDGEPEIVFGDINGTVYALKNDGTLLWKYSLPAFYFKEGIFGAAPSGAISFPSIADLNGDGYLEIVFAVWCHGVFIFSHDGKLLKQWPRPFGIIGFLGASIADIDSDGDLEILVGMAGKRGFFGRLGIIDQIP